MSQIETISGENAIIFRAKADAIIVKGKHDEAIEPQMWLRIASLLFAATLPDAE